MTMPDAPTLFPTAIVTGGASGIGRAFSVALARSGVLVFVADRQLNGAERVVREIVEAGGQARAAELDVRDGEQFSDLAAAVVRSAGRIDYLFNNAGVGVLGQAARFSRADWSEALDVNLKGTCHGIAAAYPQMLRQQHGHIVNIASLAGLVPAPLAASYTASKFGVVGLSRALRVEASRHGVRVSVVCPFIVDTPLLSGGRYSRINDDARSMTAGRPLLQYLAVQPDRLARHVLRQLARNQAVIVYPTWARLLWNADRLSPWISERVTGALMDRFLR